MTSEKTLVLSKLRVTSLVQFSALTAIAVFAPLTHNQIITGSLVNATLFIAAATLGFRGATLISFVPSLLALFFGTLPISLAPFIPFIILSNILLVLVFISFRKANYFVRIFSAAALKFLFLFTISSWAFSFLFQGALFKTALIMLGWPQLITALIGGALAYAFLKGSKSIA